MEGKRIEIEGIVYDLEDPAQKKAAIKTWLEAKARERETRDGAEGESPPREEERNP